MNTRALEILNSEQEKNRYYDSAEELLKAAGLKNIHVDRTQLSIVPHGSCGRLMIRVAVEKFNKRTVKASELKALKRYPAISRCMTDTSASRVLRCGLYMSGDT